MIKSALSQRLSRFSPRKPILQLACLLACWGGSLLPASLEAQEQCRVGLHFRVSPQGTRGAYPVLMAVLPYSPAAKAGLRAGDVITSIDGIPTVGRSSRLVSELFVRAERAHLVTFERVGAGEQTVLLRPFCKAPEVLTERELALAFAGYSQQDAMSTTFSYPFTFRGGEANWSALRTFAFAPSSPGSEAIDRPIYAEVARLLQAKGLELVTGQADLLVEAFYSLQPSADSRRDTSQAVTSVRYAPTAPGVQVLPLLPTSSTAGSAYELQLTIQLSSPSQPTVPLWSCEAKERLSEAMTLPAYALSALPVMLQAFPYLPKTTPATYRYDALRYLYTGILYDSRDLSRIADVEEGSPAFRAGLRTGDRIRSINGKRFGISSVERLSSAYRDFLGETFKLRETAELAPGLRPWETKSFGAVRKALERDPEETIFSYLFFFRPYINDSEHTLLLFDIERAGRSYSLSIAPELRDESTLIPD